MSMTRIFCDHCKKEIQRNYVKQRLFLRHTVDGITFHIQVLACRASNSGFWDTGDLCFSCLKIILEHGVECEGDGALIVSGDSTTRQGKDFTAK